MNGFSLGFAAVLFNFWAYVGGYVLMTWPPKLSGRWLNPILIILMAIWFAADYWGVRMAFLLEVPTIFLLFSRGFPIPKWMVHGIQTLSSLTFGIYLVHPLFCGIVKQKFRLQDPDVLGPVCGSLVGILVIFIASAMVTAVLRKIPYLKRVV